MLILFLSFFLASAFAEKNFTCQATYDSLEIPHIKTNSEEEFYYCFGFHHGKDRAWEMDYFRRSGQGRNAEILGFDQLKSDLMMRLLDLPRKAESLWSGFSPEKKKLIEYYSEGVNAGFKVGRKGREFQDLKFEPEPWKAQHSLLVLLLQSFDQTRKTFFRDYEEQKAIEAWGDKAAALHDEDDVPWMSTILKEGEYFKKDVLLKKTSFSQKKLKLWSEFPAILGEESGSNNWVISSKKSKTGKAILANDPHLDLKTPMFWYWINLKSNDVSVMGASLPGVPVIASGTNGKVSWGLTNSYINTADAVFIKDLPEKSVETIRPKVLIKWWVFKIPFFFKSFEKLVTGHPILPLELESSEKLVLRWAGFALKPEDVYPMLTIFNAQNVSEMDKALEGIGVPAWNFVFADVKGEIGYRMVGKSYRNAEKLPFGISSETWQDFQKEDFLDPSERPHVLRPKRNFVASANNRHWPQDANLYGGRGYSMSYRAYRIEELLEGKHDAESFKLIQCDGQVVDARFFVERILKHIAVPAFKDWKFTSEDSSLALPLYRRLMDLMLKTWEVNEYALYKLLDNLSSEQHRELQKIYQEALNDVGDKRWGEIHVVNFAHMSKRESWVFSPEIAGVGDNHSVNPGTSKWNEDREIYEQNAGASMRMIIEMSEPVKIQLALPGHNRNYTEESLFSPWKAWKNCQYSELTL